MNRPTSVRYRIVAWLAVAAAIAYLCRNAVSPAAGTISRELALDPIASGWIMGAFFWTYAVFQMPAGVIAEWYGTRVTLTVVALAWSLATLSIGLAPGFATLIVAQLLMGVAQAGLLPAACNSIGHWLPISQRSMASGFLNGGMQVGAIAASVLTGTLLAGGLFGSDLPPLNWRWVFVLFSLPGCLWAVTFLVRFRNQPEQVRSISPGEVALIREGQATPAAGGSGAPYEERRWGEVMLDPNVWFVCGQQICRSSGYMFFASWFPQFLQATRGVSVETAGYLQAFVLSGTLAGSLVGGFVSDWVWRRTGDLRLSRGGLGAMALGTCGLLVLAAWFVTDVRLAVALLMLGSFAAAIAGPCMYSSVIEIGRGHVPQLFGLVNMTGNLAVAACPVLIGFLFSLTENWNLILIIFAGIYLLGAFCWILVNPGRRAESRSVVRLAEAE